MTILPLWSTGYAGGILSGEAEIRWSQMMVVSVVAAVLVVLKVVQEGFRKVALGKAVRMEVSRLRLCQGKDITKAWQQLLNAIAETLPSLKDECHGNETIYPIKALLLSYRNVLFKFCFLYFCSEVRESCYYTCTCTCNTQTLLASDVPHPNDQVFLPSITGHQDYSSTQSVL